MLSSADGVLENFTNDGILIGAMSRSCAYRKMYKYCLWLNIGTFTKKPIKLDCHNYYYAKKYAR